jgi:hypothetical protein
LVFVVLVLFIVVSVVVGAMLLWVLIPAVESIGVLPIVFVVLMSPPLVVVVVVALVLVLVVSAARLLFPQAPTAHMAMSAPTILIDRLCISSSLFESVVIP